MKIAALLIGLILIVGGLAGVARPHAWTYTVSASRWGRPTGARTVDSDGATTLAWGSVVLGTVVLGGAAWSVAGRNRLR